MTLLKINFLKKSFRNTIRVSKGLDPDQSQTACKGYQQKTKVVTGKKRVNPMIDLSVVVNYLPLKT